MLSRPACAALTACFLLGSAGHAPADDLPKAKFSAEIDGIEWTIKFVDGGKFEVTRDDEPVARGKYKATGEEIELIDEKVEGEDANTTPGKYTWKLDGKKLSFKKVEDDHKGRVGALTAKPWSRVD